MEENAEGRYVDMNLHYNEYRSHRADRNDAGRMSVKSNISSLSKEDLDFLKEKRNFRYKTRKREKLRNSYNNANAQVLSTRNSMPLEQD